MLHEFLTTNHDELVARTRAKVASRMASQPAEAELQNGIPLFLKQLVARMTLATSDSAAIEKSAGKYGADLQKLGFTVDQVVHGYGDVCQAVTELADETNAPITADEFHTFNRCLDDAIAHAVTEYSCQHDRSIAADETERMGILAHELRNRLTAAMLSFSILKRGNVAIGGSTGAVLRRSLQGMRDLVSNSIAETRLESGPKIRRRVSMFGLLEELEIEASLEATARGIEFAVTSNERGLDVEADQQLLTAAVSNLLENAFTCSGPSGHVSLRTSATSARVLIEVEDECGGLPPGMAEELSRPFERHGAGRSGPGHGLSISKRSVEANGGELRVRDLPGKGCIVTIDLPRMPPP
jgi:signal transduction histidine kinase